MPRTGARCATFEDYLRAHEERFEPKDGPLRPVVKESVEAFLECGRLTSGFARIRCPKCAAEHLLAFSCRTRNLRPSCQAKRAALLSEHLETVLAPVAHRHFVFTIPKALRGLFARERPLLALLPRCACRGRAGRSALDPDPLEGQRGVPADFRIRVRERAQQVRLDGSRCGPLDCQRDGRLATDQVRRVA